jgi:hypothetical protein
MSDDTSLVKIHIELPNHWATGGESMWARSLGDDLYAIDNVPFYAYGLNAEDVVRAVSLAPDLKPEIQVVVRPSGRRTIRVHFHEDTKEDVRIAFVEQLQRFGAGFERATSRLFAIDINPDGNYDGLRDHLDRAEASDTLAYETCEARSAGTFDALPE